MCSKRFTEIAKSLGNIVVVRSLLYQIIFISKEPDSLLLASIISTWPSILQESNCDQKNLDILLITIKYLVQNIKKNDDNQEIFSLLFTKCNWLQNDNISIEEIIIRSVEELKTNELNEEKLFEVGAAFQLLCKYKGWTWTYNFLICKNLATLMVPSSSESTIISVIHLLGKICKTGIYLADNPSISGISQLRSRISFLLISGTPG